METNQTNPTDIEPDASADDGCRCSTCEQIHADFIATFGRWPTMSHDDGIRVQERRDRAEASWDRLLR